MKQLIKRLGLNVDENNKFWQSAFAKAKNEEEIPFFISKEYVEKIQTEYGVFPKNFELLLSAVDGIRQNKDLCMLAKIFYHLFFLNVDKNEIFADFELPTPPKDYENTLAYDLFSVFPIMAHIPKSYAILKERGVDDDVCRDSHCQLDTCISESSEEKNRPCFTTDYFLSYGAFIYLSTLRIGRFRFQIAKKSNLGAFVFENSQGQLKVLMNGVSLDKEGYVLGTIGHSDDNGSFVANVTEEKDCFVGYAVDNTTYLAQVIPTRLDKKEWKVLYKPNDAVIMVHIPFAGSFDKEYCEESYERAREIFARCYAEYNFKCFTTATWFLAPVLDKVLKPTSNIYNFRKKYTIFPNKCGGLDVFNYVYKLHPTSFDKIDLSVLPEDNSLRKGIKERLLNGEYVHEFKGVFKF